MKLRATLLAMSAAVTVAGTSHAITIFDSTEGGPVFHRPNPGAPPVSLAAGGQATAVHFNALQFTVETSGRYDFAVQTLRAPETGRDWPAVLVLYQDVFVPGVPLLNAVVADDDLRGFGNPGFQSMLTAGRTYIAVTTGYFDGNFGRYQLSITQAVPEPASWALMACGLAAAGLARRRALHRDRHRPEPMRA